MTVLYPNLCYNEVHYKATALYVVGAQKNCLIEIVLLIANKGLLSKLLWSRHGVVDKSLALYPGVPC